MKRRTLAASLLMLAVPVPGASAATSSVSGGAGLAAPPTAKTKPKPKPVKASLDVSGYVNPISKVRDLVPERVDMGVDYSGSGPLLAIGAGTIDNIYNDGWPGGAFIELKFSTGRYAGYHWYYAEDVTPTVRVGQQVAAGAEIGVLYEGGEGLETGWSIGDGGTTLAASLNQQDPAGDPGGWSSAAGASANRFLKSLRARPGYLQGAVHGRMPAGYP
jgi:murein DD-endopeptidase MepM/ murein hydrolase activator NlpD